MSGTIEDQQHHPQRQQQQKQQCMPILITEPEPMLDTIEKQQQKRKLNAVSNTSRNQPHSRQQQRMSIPVPEPLSGTSRDQQQYIPIPVPEPMPGNSRNQRQQRMPESVPAPATTEMVVTVIVLPMSILENENAPRLRPLRTAPSVQNDQRVRSK